MDESSAADTPDGSPISLALWLVNDDRSQLMVQKRLLGRVAVVRGFLSPLEALAAARADESSSPNLITDFHMPDMDGPDLARLWCDMHPDARVLVISASEVSRQEQARIDSLPSSAVKLLTSYRIGDLHEQAQTWFREVSSPNSPDFEPEPRPLSQDRLDPTVLEKLGKLGGALFLAKTVERFLRSAPEKVQALKKAFHDDDLAQVHALSHSLKGSCGLVGANALAAVADAVETSTSENGDRSCLSKLMNDLENECDATIAELEKLYR